MQAFASNLNAKDKIEVSRIEINDNLYKKCKSKKSCCAKKEGEAKTCSKEESKKSCCAKKKAACSSKATEEK